MGVGGGIGNGYARQEGRSGLRGSQNRYLTRIDTKIFSDERVGFG
jgi:hypothetical protein